MELPRLGHPLWRVALSKQVAGQAECTEEGDAEESDCRVLLWDRSRDLVATIDSRELRWYMDSKESPLSNNILNADTNRRSCVTKGQKGAWVTGCGSVWMSSDGSKFFVGYPTLRIFCEWNSECPDDVFARYHVIDTQVQLQVPSLHLQLMLSAAHGVMLSSSNGDIRRTSYNCSTMSQQAPTALTSLPPRKNRRTSLDSPPPTPSPDAADVAESASSALPSQPFTLLNGCWYRDPWRKWTGQSSPSPASKCPQLCLTATCTSPGTGRWGEQTPLFSISPYMAALCSRYGTSQTSTGEAGRGCRCLSCTMNDRIWCGTPRRAGDCVSSDTHLDKLLKQPKLAICFCRNGDAKGVKLQCVVCDDWFHERCLKDCAAYPIDFVPGSLKQQKSKPKSPAEGRDNSSTLVCPSCAVIYGRLKQVHAWFNGRSSSGQGSRSGVAAPSSSAGAVASDDATSKRLKTLLPGLQVRVNDPSHACHKQTCVIQFVKGEVFHLKFKSGEIHKFKPGQFDEIRASHHAPQAAHAPPKQAVPPRIPWNKGISWHKGQDNPPEKREAIPPHKVRGKPSHKKKDPIPTMKDPTPTSASKRQRDTASDNEDAAAAVAPAAKSTPHKVKPAVYKPTQAELHALQRQEMSSIMRSITNDGFELKHVEPDGSCLFRAMSLQLVVNDSSWTARKLRQAAADYLESHESEYVHFIDDSLGSFKEYCRRIRGSHWGSDIEIQALCKVTGYSVQVYSAERTIWFHPDIDPELQIEIEHAHVGLCANEDGAEARPKVDAGNAAIARPSSHHSKAPKGFIPMDISDYMSDAARAFCLSAGHAPLRGEPFSKLELNAQLSFVLDNPTLPIGSRKTWDIFIKQTGSKRNSDSLKSFVNSTIVKQNLQVLSSAESTVPCESSSAAPINSHGASNDGPLSSSHRPDKHALDMQDSLSMQDFSELPIFESPPTSSSDESCEIGADDNVERDCPESPVTSAAIDADDTLTAENIHTTAPITAAGSSPVPPSDAPASSLCSGAQLPIPCSSYFTKGMAAEGYPLSNYLACFKILRLSFHKHEMCGGEHYNAVISRRRTAGQEWQASAFADPPTGRRRKSEADSEVSKPPKFNKKGPTSREAEESTDHDGVAISGELAPDSAIAGEEFLVGHADVSGCASGIPLGDSSNILTANNGSSRVDYSLASDTVSLRSSLSVWCPSDASPLAVGDALSPIDNVPSCDAAGAAAQLEMSAQSLILPHQGTDASLPGGGSAHCPNSSLSAAIAPLDTTIADVLTDSNSSWAARAADDQRGSAADSGHVIAISDAGAPTETQ